MPHDHAIHQLIRTPCKVHHSDPGVTDEYGDNPVAMETVTDERCYLSQSSAGEDDNVEAERWEIYLLPTTDVDANDLIEVDGMMLEVWGMPWHVIDPVTGWRTHTEATVVRRR